MATSMETIHMETIHKRHRFEVRKETQRGNTTATKRSTAITTKLWTDTSNETSAKYGVTLHVKICHNTSGDGPGLQMEIHKSHRHNDQGKQQIRHGHVDDEKVDWFSSKLVFCKRLLLSRNFRGKKQRRGCKEQWFLQFGMLHG